MKVVFWQNGIENRRRFHVKKYQCTNEYICLNISIVRAVALGRETPFANQKTSVLILKLTNIGKIVSE